MIVPSRSGRSATIPAARRRESGRSTRVMHDRVRPFPVDVDVVARGVEIPGANARRTAADLAEAQTLGPEEPLHVRRRRPDAERLDGAQAELAHLRVVRRGVDAVGRDELRADPALAHRLEHVRVVVRDEVVGGVAVDADGVVEALVTFDELLDGDVRWRPTAPSSASARSSSASESTRLVPDAPGGGAGFEDDRVADRGDEVAHLRRAGRARRLRRLDPDGAQRLLHRRLVPAQIRRAHRRPRDAARLASVRGRHRVRLDRQLERVDPHLALREAHRLDERTDVGDVRDLLVVEHPAAQVAVEPVGRTLADADHVGAGLRETADEFALVRRKCRLDEDDVHAQILPAEPQPARDAHEGSVRLVAAATAVLGCCVARPRRSSSWIAAASRATR